MTSRVDSNAGNTWAATDNNANGPITINGGAGDDFIQLVIGGPKPPETGQVSDANDSQPPLPSNDTPYAPPPGVEQNDQSNAPQPGAQNSAPQPEGQSGLPGSNGELPPSGVEGDAEPQWDENPLCAGEEARVWGDPHFIGADGGKFDIMGEPGKTYNLLSDDGLQFNARFDSWGNGATAVGETGMTLTGEDGSQSKISFDKDGKAVLDGEEMEVGKEYELADGGTAILDEDGKLTVTTGEGYQIEQTAQNGYVNTKVTAGEHGVDNGRMPSGMLGQTFDEDDLVRHATDKQGTGAIEGSYEDYEMDFIFDSAELNGGAGDDRIRTDGISQYKVDIDGGSGDDSIEIPNDGMDNVMTVEGGSGDDAVYVGNEGSGNEVTIDGGSGEDTVYFAGEPTFKGMDGDYRVFEDENGNITRVHKDIENIETNVDVPEAPEPPEQPAENAA